MNLFVQVAFDLEDCKRPEYKEVESWLNSVGLRRVINEKGKEVRFPANTFGGIRNQYDSREAAIKHVQDQLDLAAREKAFSGQATITVSLAESTRCEEHPFSGLTRKST